MFCGHGRKQDIKNVIVGTQKRNLIVIFEEKKYIVIIEFRAVSILFFLTSPSYY